VDPVANHAADVVYRFGSNLRQGRMNIGVERTKYSCACSIDRVINGSRILLTLRSTSWTKLWPDPELTSCPGRKTVVDGRLSEGNECWVDFINQ